MPRVKQYGYGAKAAAARRITSVARAALNRGVFRSMAFKRAANSGVATRNWRRGAFGVKDFVITTTPFNLALIEGTAATSGVQWYGDGQVPNAPASGTGSNIFSLAFMLTGTQAYVNGALQGTFQNANYTEYSALFDSFRIKEVEITMVYNSNQSGISTNTSSLPTLWLANDYDDMNATSLASLQQYPSGKPLQFGNSSGSNNGKQVWRLRPKTQIYALSAAGTTVAMSGQSSAWYDTNTSTSSSLEWFGLKGFHDNQQSTSTATPVGFVTFYVKYFMQFKDTR